MPVPLPSLGSPWFAFTHQSTMTLDLPPGLITQSRDCRNSVLGIGEANRTGLVSASHCQCTNGTGRRNTIWAKDCLPVIYKIIMQTWMLNLRFRHWGTLVCSVLIPVPFSSLLFPCSTPSGFSGLSASAREFPFWELSNHSAPGSKPSGQCMLPGWQSLAFQSQGLVMLCFPVFTLKVSWHLDEGSTAASQPPPLYSTLAILHHSTHTAHSFFVLQENSGEGTDFYPSCLPST